VGKSLRLGSTIVICALMVGTCVSLGPGAVGASGPSLREAHVSHSAPRVTSAAFISGPAGTGTSGASYEVIALDVVWDAPATVPGQPVIGYQLDIGEQSIDLPSTQTWYIDWTSSVCQGGCYGILPTSGSIEAAFQDGSFSTPSAFSIQSVNQDATARVGPISESIPADGSVNVSWNPPFGIGPLNYTALVGRQECASNLGNCTMNGLPQTQMVFASVCIFSDISQVYAGEKSCPRAKIGVYPVVAKQLSILGLPRPYSQTESVVVYGVNSGQHVSVRLQKSSASCAANVVGQCSVLLKNPPPGQVVISATSGSQSTSLLWFWPKMNIPTKMKAGKSYVLGLNSLLPNAPVEIDDQVGVRSEVLATGEASISGTLNIPVSLSRRGLHNLTIFIGGTAFPAYQVQVS